MMIIAMIMFVSKILFLTILISIGSILFITIFASIYDLESKHPHIGAYAQSHTPHNYNHLLPLSIKIVSAYDFTHRQDVMDGGIVNLPNECNPNTEIDCPLKVYGGYMYLKTEISGGYIGISDPKRINQIICTLNGKVISCGSDVENLPTLRGTNTIGFKWQNVETGNTFTVKMIDNSNDIAQASWHWKGVRNNSID
jgi:hypothetical protein